MSSCPRSAAARATSSGIATSSRCSWETTGQTSATIANSRSPPRAIGSIWPSTSTTRATTNPGVPDRDVVEMFLGDDWTNIRHYREFEIAPTGDWIDLAIDLDHESYDQSWRS